MWHATYLVKSAMGADLEKSAIGRIAGALKVRSPAIKAQSTRASVAQTAKQRAQAQAGQAAPRTAPSVHPNLGKILMGGGSLIGLAALANQYAYPSGSHTLPSAQAISANRQRLAAEMGQ